MNQLTVQNTNTQLSITTATTANEWYNIKLPAACAALGILSKKPEGLVALRPAEALLAVVAYKVTSLSMLTGLAANTANALMPQLSIRTLQAELVANEAQNPARAAMISSTLESGLQKKLRQLSLAYLNASTEKLSKEDAEFLLTACEELITTRYAGFSIAELDAAFAHAAANAEFKAYGVLNVQLLTSLLDNYKRARSAALVAILKEEEAIQKNIDFLNTVAEKNDAAYEEALAELKALQTGNCKHASFHSCPHHYVRRFIENSIISFSSEDKKEIYSEARAQAAYDLANDAPSLTARKALGAFLSGISLVPIPSHRVVSSDIVKANLNSQFDYKNITLDSFNQHAGIYYAKKLYYASIEIYQPK
jgi:hypothetical protein